MNSKRWSEVENIFHAGKTCKRADRALFLDRACGEDRSLRAEVESLLSAADDSEGFLEVPVSTRAMTIMGKTQKEEMIGKILSSYQVIARLGEGGMGEVYLCEDIRLGRKVALKLLPSRFAADEVAINRFRQEARTASSLNHPNIITIHEIGEADGRYFIATEFVEGQTLRQLIESGDLNPAEILRIITDVARALEAAHSAGIIHRDIKPENIMVRDDGLVKVLDFGLARQPLTSPSNQLSVTSIPGLILGTISYMSPEQIRGLAVDERSDLWSLGVVLFEMVTGERLFLGETPADVLASIIGNPSILNADRGITFSVWSVVLRRAVCSERDERYQTAREMLSDLNVICLDNESSPGSIGRFLENSATTRRHVSRLSGLQNLTSSHFAWGQSSWRIRLSVGGLLVTLITLISGLGIHYGLAGRFQGLAIDNLTPSTNKPYAVGHLNTYSTAFIDRSTHSFTGIPSFLLNQLYIITANDDRCAEREPSYSLAFDVTEPVTLYLAHDDRYEKKPAWMDPFERTQNTLTLFLLGHEETYGYHLYKRDYPAGRIVLGSNIDGSCGEQGSFAMYSVIVMPRTHSVSDKTSR